AWPWPPSGGEPPRRRPLSRTVAQPKPAAARALSASAGSTRPRSRAVPWRPSVHGVWGSSRPGNASSSAWSAPERASASAGVAPRSRGQAPHRSSASRPPGPGCPWSGAGPGGERAATLPVAVDGDHRRALLDGDLARLDVVLAQPVGELDQRGRPGPGGDLALLDQVAEGRLDDAE